MVACFSECMEVGTLSIFLSKFNASFVIGSKRNRKFKLVCGNLSLLFH